MYGSTTIYLFFHRFFGLLATPTVMVNCGAYLGGLKVTLIYPANNACAYKQPLFDSPLPLSSTSTLFPNPIDSELSC